MILQKLAEYYDRVTADPSTSDALPKPGYSTQKISFCVILNPDGYLQQIDNITEPAGKKRIPRMLLVPGQGKPSGSGINPCFLWDNSAYMLGYRLDDQDPARTAEAFDTFKQRHVDLEKQIDSPGFRAVCTFLRNWLPADIKSKAPDIDDMIGSFGVFRLAGEQQYIHDDPAVITYWLQQQSLSDGETVKGFCLVTGTQQPIARLHEPKIKNVRGAQSSGALLVSLNSDAYTSFGKDQSYNAPVGEASVFKYANALNYLLSQQNRRTFLGDATVISWADKPSPDADNITSFITAYVHAAEVASAEDKTRARQVQNFLQQLRDGQAAHEAIDPNDNTPFYILGLSAAARSRLGVRLWIQSTIGQLKAKLIQHMRDVDIDGLSSGLSIYQIAAATARTIKGKVDTATILSGLTADIAKAVLQGTPYPLRLLTATLSRVAADGQITPARAAVIKAYLKRIGDTAMDAYLNSEHPSPAYHCGRLLAVLAFAQEQAQGTLNAGVVRRNLGSVMTAPGLHLGRLQKAAEVGHIPKLERDIPIFVRDELMAINVQLRDCVPPTLSLAEQGTFMLGFYQELRRLDGIGEQVKARKLYRTSQGEWVRSKGEVRLANLLAKFGCRYLYEARAILSGAERWPDFLIPASKREDDIYIEYLGMDNEHYNHRWEDKLRGYTEFGAPSAGGPNGRLIILDARALGKIMPESMMRDLLRPVLDALTQDTSTGDTE